jgi:Cu2+-exporting ATPase
MHEMKNEHSQHVGHETEGPPVDHSMHTMNMEHGNSDMHDMDGMSGNEHHANMVADFKRRFWISLIFTVPILLLSPLIQKFLGLEGKINLTGDSYILLALSSVVFFYGGWPFLKGIFSELRAKTPGMMTLIALAISVFSLALTRQKGYKK